MTKQIDSYKCFLDVFASIKGDSNLMTNGYTYLGCGGINSTPKDEAQIWVNHEAKVWKCVHWTEQFDMEAGKTNF